MRQTKEQPSVTERATGEQKRKIWEAIFGLAGVEEKIALKSGSLLRRVLARAFEPLSPRRVLARVFEPAEDVMKKTLRVRHLVSFPESESQCPLVIDYYRGAAACLWIDLSGLVNNNVLAGYSGVFIQKSKVKDGLALVFNDKGEGSSLTLTQGEALFKLLTPSETSRAE
jgi:hypothetical protein